MHSSELIDEVFMDFCVHKPLSFNQFEFLIVCRNKAPTESPPNQVKLKALLVNRLNHCLFILTGQFRLKLLEPKLD